MQVIKNLLSSDYYTTDILKSKIKTKYDTQINHKNSTLVRWDNFSFTGKQTKCTTRVFKFTI